MRSIDFVWDFERDARQTRPAMGSRHNRVYEFFGSRILFYGSGGWDQSRHRWYLPRAGIPVEEQVDGTKEDLDEFKIDRRTIGRDRSFLLSFFLSFSLLTTLFSPAWFRHEINESPLPSLMQPLSELYLARLGNWKDRSA